jgi:hypothetical protein
LKRNANFSAAKKGGKPAQALVEHSRPDDEPIGRIER